MYKILLSAAVAIIIGLFGLPSFVLAAPYGEGTYSECAYSQDCPAPPQPPPEPTPPPAVPEPEPGEPTTSVKFENINSGETINQSPITIVISVDRRDSNNQPIVDDSLGWVSFYVDDELVETQYNKDANGNFIIDWDVVNFPGENLTAIAFDKDGNPIGEINLIVKIDDELAEFAQSQQINNQNFNNQANGSTGGQVAGEIKNRGVFSNILGETGSLGELGKISDPIELPQIVETIAVTFPLWIFIILALLAVRLLWQASREAIAAKRIKTLAAIENDINEQKAVFISLASHYLNTPLTLIKSGIDMFDGEEGVAQTTLSKLKEHSANLQNNINNLIDSARQEAVKVAQISNADVAYFEKPIYKNPAFWIPIVSVGMVMAIINLLLQILTTVSLNAIELFVQAIVFGAVVIFLMLSIRSARLRKKEKEFANHALEQQENLDSSRNQFISTAAAKLRSAIDNIIQYSYNLKSAKSYKYLAEGIRQFQDNIYKFELAKSVEKGAVNVNNIQTIDINQFIDGALQKNIDAINIKQLAINNNTPAVNVSQNLVLFGFVLDTVINNAVKFSKDGGSIAVDIKESNGRINVTVADQGIGIAKSKMSKLFTPFVRGTSVHQFDYEGMGFSLYLSKLIANRLGGDLTISSQEDVGTTVQINLPTHAV